MAHIKEKGRKPGGVGGSLSVCPGVSQRQFEVQNTAVGIFVLNEVN